MARKKTHADNGFLLFDVVYDDGTLSSHRKVGADEIDPLNPDASARAAIEAQDRKIEALSGRSRGRIKSITRSVAR